jgi:hypothetical protein
MTQRRASWNVTGSVTLDAAGFDGDGLGLVGHERALSKPRGPVQSPVINRHGKGASVIARGLTRTNP